MRKTIRALKDKLSLRVALASSAALLAAASVAFAAGMFPGLPIVGGAAYCTSFVMNPVTGAATTTCNGPTTPAGPTAITGLELIPADTQIAGGQQPQTVLLKMAGLGIGTYDYQAPLTGATITETAVMRQLIIEPAGTIATLTVVLPAATTLVDGQRWGMCSTQIVTALTITPGTGTTVSNTVTAMAVPNTVGQASCPEWIYRTANTNWYRTH